MRAAEKYRTIVVDPPWDHSEGTGAKWRTGFGETERVLEGERRSYTVPYSVLSLDEVKALPVHDFAGDRCHLYLWVTNKYLRHVWDVAEAWSFRPIRLIVWCKEPRGWNPGGKWPSTAEFCLFAGHGGTADLGGRAQSQWFVWPRRLGPPVKAGESRRTMHSAKPEAFLDEVEKVSPGPYLELFARRQRLGWDTWGNEALNHVTLTRSESPSGAVATPKDSGGGR